MCVCVKKKNCRENEQTNKINLKWNIISGKVMSLIVVHLSGLIFKGLFRLTYIPLCHIYIYNRGFICKTFAITLQIFSLPLCKWFSSINKIHKSNFLLFKTIFISFLSIRCSVVFSHLL